MSVDHQWPLINAQSHVSKRTTQTVGPQVGSKGQLILCGFPKTAVSSAIALVSYLARARGYLQGRGPACTYSTAVGSSSPRAVGSARCTCTTAKKRQCTAAWCTTEQSTAHCNPRLDKGQQFLPLPADEGHPSFCHQVNFVCPLCRPLPITSLMLGNGPGKCVPARHAAHWPCAAIPPCLALGIRQARTFGPDAEIAGTYPLLFFFFFFFYLPVSDALMYKKLVSGQGKGLTGSS